MSRVRRTDIQARIDMDVVLNEKPAVHDMNAVKSIFVWPIDTSELKSNQNIVELLSQVNFSLRETHWTILLHVKPYDSVDYVTCEFRKVNYGADMDRMLLILSFLDNQNRPHFSRMECLVVKEEQCRWEVEKIVRYQELLQNLDQYLDNGKLKLKFEIFPKPTIRDIEFPLSNFASSLNDEQFSDFFFDFGDKKIFAHKIILAKRTAVFAAMFENPMAENVGKSVHIEDIDYDVFLEMLSFIYSGRVSNIKKIAADLLAAADKYALFDLKFICSQYLCDNLTEKNVIALLNLADLYNDPTLKDKTLNFIVSNSPDLVNDPRFKSLTNLSKELMFDVIHSFALDKSKNARSLLGYDDMRAFYSHDPTYRYFDPCYPDSTSDNTSSSSSSTSSETSSPYDI